MIRVSYLDVTVEVLGTQADDPNRAHEQRGWQFHVEQRHRQVALGRADEHAGYDRKA